MRQSPFFADLRERFETAKLSHAPLGPGAYTLYEHPINENPHPFASTADRIGFNRKAFTPAPGTYEIKEPNFKHTKRTSTPTTDHTPRVYQAYQKDPYRPPTPPYLKPKYTRQCPHTGTVKPAIEIEKYGFDSTDRRFKQPINCNPAPNAFVCTRDTISSLNAPAPKIVRSKHSRFAGSDTLTPGPGTYSTETPPNFDRADSSFTSVTDRFELNRSKTPSSTATEAEFTHTNEWLRPSFLQGRPSPFFIKPPLSDDRFCSGSYFINTAVKLALEREDLERQQQRLSRPAANFSLSNPPKKKKKAAPFGLTKPTAQEPSEPKSQKKKPLTLSYSKERLVLSQTIQNIRTSYYNILVRKEDRYPVLTDQADPQLKDQPAAEANQKVLDLKEAKSCQQHYKKKAHPPHTARPSTSSSSRYSHGKKGGLNGQSGDRPKRLVASASARRPNQHASEHDKTQQEKSTALGADIGGQKADDLDEWGFSAVELDYPHHYNGVKMGPGHYNVPPPEQVGVSQERYHREKNTPHFCFRSKSERFSAPKRCSTPGPGAYVTPASPADLYRRQPKVEMIGVGSIRSRTQARPKTSVSTHSTAIGVKATTKVVSNNAGSPVPAASSQPGFRSTSAMTVKETAVVADRAPSRSGAQTAR